MPVYVGLGGRWTSLREELVVFWRVSLEVFVINLTQHPIVESVSTNGVEGGMGKTYSVKPILSGCAHSVLISSSFLSTVPQNPELGSSRYTARCGVG
jgi:hypothetical protein